MMHVHGVFLTNDLSSLEGCATCENRSCGDTDYSSGSQKTGSITCEELTSLLLERSREMHHLLLTRFGISFEQLTINSFGRIDHAD